MSCECCSKNKEIYELFSKELMNLLDKYFKLNQTETFNPRVITNELIRSAKVQVSAMYPSYEEALGVLTHALVDDFDIIHSEVNELFENLPKEEESNAP